MAHVRSLRSVLAKLAFAADVATWVVIGALAAIVSAFIAPWAITWSGHVWSVGLLLAFLVTAGALGAAAHDGKLVGAWCSASAWLVTIVALSWPRAQGDVVIPGTWYGYTFMFGGMAIAFATIAWQWWQAIAVVARESSDGAFADR